MEWSPSNAWFRDWSCYRTPHRTGHSLAIRIDVVDGMASVFNALAAVLKNRSHRINERKIMIPNLLGATQEYWRKLDEIEASYQRGELAIEEVNSQVATLMTELAKERRQTLSIVEQAFQQLLNNQRETLIGLSLIVLTTYLWLSTRSFL